MLSCGKNSKKMENIVTNFIYKSSLELLESVKKYLDLSILEFSFFFLKSKLFKLKYYAVFRKFIYTKIIKLQ